jgi:hypothetical protein
MASANFRNVTQALAKAQINFSTGAFKALLVTAVPNASALDTWIDRADVTGEHAASGGYTTGGFDVTASVAAVDTVNDCTDVTFSVTNPVYTAATISAVGCIIYLSTGVAANDLLCCFVDFGGTVASVASTYDVTFSSALRIATA